MEEPRRIQLTTVEKPSNDKTKKQAQPVARFSLNLRETTETSCPMFSFTELLKNAGDEQNEDDEEEEKLKAWAKSMVEKYGPKSDGNPKKSKKKIRESLLNLGDGYDETDNFIDNSEAYDELVPTCMTTKLGGFYINSGQLDFKYYSEDSAQEFQTPVKKKKKIRRIESDSEDEKTQMKKKLLKKRLDPGGNGEIKKKRKVTIGPDGERIFKKPKKTDDRENGHMKKKKMSPTVSELLKQQTASTSPNMAGDPPLNCSPDKMDYLFKNGDLGSPEHLTAIDSTIESVLNQINKEDSNSREEEFVSLPLDPENVPKLPMGISEQLEQNIDKLKQESKESQKGKCKFFNERVNKLLLDVEVESRQLACSKRSTIYSHLAAHLPCSKDTLLKRAKKLRISEQDDMMKRPLQKLKDAINKVMPHLQEKHVAECQLAALTSKENQSKETKEEGASTESEEDDKEPEGGKKRVAGPRKKFTWNDEIRACLCDVVRIKMKNFEVSKSRAQSPEEYVKSFLESEVKPLWPKGWMQSRILYKESRAGHWFWTNPQKVKKPVMATTKPASGATSPVSANNGLLNVKTNSHTVKQVPVIGAIKPDISASNNSVKKPEDSSMEIFASEEDLALIMPDLLDYADERQETSTSYDPHIIPVNMLGNNSFSDTSQKSNKLDPSESNLFSNAAKNSAGPHQEPNLDQISQSNTHSQGKFPPGSSNTMKRSEMENNSFLAQFQKYATSVFAQQLSSPETSPNTSPVKKFSNPATKVNHPSLPKNMNLLQQQLTQPLSHQDSLHVKQKLKSMYNPTSNSSSISIQKSLQGQQSSQQSHGISHLYDKPPSVSPLSNRSVHSGLSPQSSLSAGVNNANRKEPTSDSGTHASILGNMMRGVQPDDMPKNSDMENYLPGKVHLSQQVQRSLLKALSPQEKHHISPQQHSQQPFSSAKSSSGTIIGKSEKSSSQYGAAQSLLALSAQSRTSENWPVTCQSQMKTSPGVKWDVASIVSTQPSVKNRSPSQVEPVSPQNRILGSSPFTPPASQHFPVHSSQPPHSMTGYPSLQMSKLSKETLSSLGNISTSLQSTRDCMFTGGGYQRQPPAAHASSQPNAGQRSPIGQMKTPPSPHGPMNPNFLLPPSPLGLHQHQSPTLPSLPFGTQLPDTSRSPHGY